jgi:hypothetical protein
MEILIVVLSLSTACSLLALYLAWRALRVRTIPMRLFERLEMDYIDLDDRFGELKANFKTLRSRVGMREVRERAQAQRGDLDNSDPEPTVAAHESPEQLPGETALEWKRRVRMLISTGKLSHR